ncbi:MAG: diphosphomevalonate decarboxylase [Polyangiaceae bacterium]
MSAVTVVAHPNIALSKYWGKLDRPGNFPAVPSLSVTLEGMCTRTRVGFHGEPGADEVLLGGAPMVAGLEKVTRLLATVRAASPGLGRAVIETSNDFPTGSGLASSASGFAALSLAAVRAAKLDWDVTRVSGLARAASASAARSLFGGFVELPLEAEGARPFAPASALPLTVLVCVATESAKKVASTDGMGRTSRESPYYPAWLAHAKVSHAELGEALLRGDFTRVGELAERSALAMHASALAAGVVYVKGVTLDALEAVWALRARGVEAYATMDAGPHVKVLVRPTDADRVRGFMAEVPGVLRVLTTRPGEGARVVEEAE